MNVLEKLAQVQQKLAVPKKNTNSFANYNYRNVEDIEKAVKPLLKDVKATIILQDKMVEVGGRVYVEATARFVDLEYKQTNGIYPTDNAVTATAYAREAENKKGMDDSQLTGATSSYARKYALGGLLLIDNEKDSDSTNTHGKESKPESPRTQNMDLNKKKKEVLDALIKAKLDPAKFVKEILDKDTIDSIEEGNTVLEAIK